MPCIDESTSATGKVLKRIRGDLTVPQAAERAGVDQSTWWRIEQGEITSPTTRTLLAISEAFDVPVTDLINPGGPAPAKKRAATTTPGG